MLHRLCHASVIHCYGIQIYPREALMVLELMEGGNLFDRIVQKGESGGFTDQEVATLLEQMADGPRRFVAIISRFLMIFRDF